MISVTQVHGSGTYNVIGTDGDVFTITGNLSREELGELRERIDEALNELSPEELEAWKRAEEQG